MGRDGALRRPVDAAARRPYHQSESVVLRDFVPVHHVPPRLDVVRTAVLVVEIIRVFPDIDAEEWCVPFHQRAVLVRCRSHLELPALVLDQPGPPAAETLRSSVREFFLERVEAAEGGFDVVAEFPRGFPAFVRAHDLPKEGMVRMPTTIVADNAANVFRD